MCSHTFGLIINNNDQAKFSWNTLATCFARKQADTIWLCRGNGSVVGDRKFQELQNAICSRCREGSSEFMGSSNGGGERTAYPLNMGLNCDAIVGNCAKNEMSCKFEKWHYRVGIPGTATSTCFDCPTDSVRRVVRRCFIKRVRGGVAISDLYASLLIRGPSPAQYLLLGVNSNRHRALNYVVGKIVILLGN